jgi:hypothetical protein
MKPFIKNSSETPILLLGKNPLLTADAAFT